MNYGMAIGAKRNQIDYWINYVTFTLVCHRNYVMHMDEVFG